MCLKRLKAAGAAIRFAVIAANILVGFMAYAQPSTPAQVIRGDVLYREGEFYVIKDMTGHEVRLHVDKSTVMTDRIKVGDKIEAQVDSNGHANSIRLQLPDDTLMPRGFAPTPSPY